MKDFFQRVEPATTMLWCIPMILGAILGHVLDSPTVFWSAWAFSMVGGLAYGGLGIFYATRPR